MKTKVGIVVSKFNEEITSLMEKNAVKVAKKLGAEITKTIYVPGAFEIPFAAKKLFENHEIEVVVVLGAVIRGQTDHDAVIVNTIAPKLLELSLKSNKPLLFLVIIHIPGQKAKNDGGKVTKK